MQSNRNASYVERRAELIPMSNNVYSHLFQNVLEEINVLLQKYAATTSMMALGEC
jgi:hypothetical protein